VKHENFKTCDQSGFCKRNRAYADIVSSLGSSWTSPYTLVSDTIKINNGRVTGTILKSVGDGHAVELPLTINIQGNGVARIIVDEAKRRKGDIELRHGSQARKERYNEVGDWALVGDPKLDLKVNGESSSAETIVSYGPDNKYKVVIKHDPLKIEFVKDGEVHVKFNGNGLMNMEHWRPKIEKEVKPEGEEAQGEQATEQEADKGEDESTWWDESFGGNTDSKPKGPESVAMDITFPGYEHVYGIPEHASSLSLKETRYES